MQGQPAHPAARPRRTGRPGRHPVRVRHRRQPGARPVSAPSGTRAPARARSDRLGDVAGWGPVATPDGPFLLLPVRDREHLGLLHRWMNDPVVAEYWDLAGPPARTEEHLRAQTGGDGRSVPCLGLLDGRPTSYWEIYRADLDPLADHYAARPHDTGVHLLIGEAADRGRGLGTLLLDAVARLVLDRRPGCLRLVAEPDLRNHASLGAFRKAGFRRAGTLELPGKRAALMIRGRGVVGGTH
ncbi:GNAT family N-acetyltransferase [Streptomyces abyssomicinicus]|uniref:GNAT family N-acetyltransferase n=1 Tax=Streptomyces abyssomicinicus TaxID=574929 RepID=UPI0012509CEB|nr:GNAT family N-acetyltransferase [Streptomyces abyssomicinicus]